METSFALSAQGQSIASGTTLMAGAAEAVVTPRIKGLKAYDDLYVRALVLADETQRLAIVTTDLLIFHSPYIEVLLEAINKAK